MAKVTIRQLTDADTEWLNEPISYNPHSVRNLMKSRERTQKETDGHCSREEAEEGDK